MSAADQNEASPPHTSAEDGDPGTGDPGASDESRPVAFSPEEEAALRQESNDKKAQANTLFSSQDYPAALAKYGEALAVCPHHLDYELALLRCNVSACHLKLREWKEAVASATAALDGLGRLDVRDAEEAEAGVEGDEEVEEEIVSAGASKAAPAPGAPDERAQRREDRKRIRAKALMRRARARCESGGWQDLSGAEEDYRALEGMDNLGPADRRMVKEQLKVLPARTKAAQEKEMAEMWGKLKDLGNGILKPFGLSTENFQMKKDENSGGYSMSFNPGSGSGPAS